ncbi:hypothetical protein TIFTF001_023700 [Ficus carica]|uniref:F-box domain-containing protein n=1 Tax=Ficus carica TaxID=3494 RepID=A0AA88DE17_FICCA|nr:hypothetical protein TIFTF001_023700 [Ficus carica]
MESSLSEKQGPNWLSLPRDVTLLIFTRLGAVEILKSAQRVCSSWLEICKDPLLWRIIDMRNLSSLSQWSFLLLNLKAMCRRAVDRSSGELVEIFLENSATSELLMYNAERLEFERDPLCVNVCSWWIRVLLCEEIEIECLSAQNDERVNEKLTLKSAHLKSRKIKILRIHGGHFSNSVLSRAASRLPLLEKLELSHCTFSKRYLKLIGRRCPHLKSLTLVSYHGYVVYIGYDKKVEFDEEAIAIAKHMSKPRHLKAFWNPGY